MELSENQSYINYMNLFADSRYESAVAELEKCIKDFHDDNIKRSFLLKLIADAYFHAGKIERSFEYYSMSEMADSESLQPKLFFAEFLARKVKKYNEAIQKCNEISRIAKEVPFEETEEDFGSDYYVSKAEEVKSLCLQKIAEQDG